MFAGVCRRHCFSERLFTRRRQPRNSTLAARKFFRRYHLGEPPSPDRLLTRGFFLLGRGSLTDPLLSNNSIYSAEGPLATRVFPERELKLATRARPTRPTSDPRVGYTFTWQIDSEQIKHIYILIFL